MTTPPPKPPRVHTAISLPLRPAGLSRRRAHDFHLRPDAPARAGLARDLGLAALRKLDLQGELVPEGRDDWRLTATLGATAVQACVVSGAPVTTRIDTPVTRRFLAELPEPEGNEAEIPEDDSLEALPVVIDLGEVMREALVLALPDYPRAEAATLPAVAETGDADETDAPRPNPFAALAALRDAGGGKDDDGR